MPKTVGDSNEESEDTESSEDEPITLDLQKPIMNFSEEVKTLTFTAPTPGQYRKFKTPFLMVEGTLDPIPERVIKYLPGCCNLAEAAVGQLSLTDLFAAGIALSSFFGGSASEAGDQKNTGA